MLPCRSVGAHEAELACDLVVRKILGVTSIPRTPSCTSTTTAFYRPLANMRVMRHMRPSAPPKSTSTTLDGHVYDAHVDVLAAVGSEDQQHAYVRRGWLTLYRGEQ